jgi:K+-sensing histidine kinase KdpD
MTRLEHFVSGAVRSRRAVAAAAAALLVLFFVIEVVTGSPREPATIAYAVPVALAAIALGARAGMVAAVAGAALYWLGAYVDGETLSAAHLSYRLGALVFLGGVVGALASQLAEAEHHAQLQQELRSRAVELNDTVVQGLALSRYQIEGGDATAAAGTLTTTLGRAQELVADLMGDLELESGALRRARPADVGGRS